MDVPIFCWPATLLALRSGPGTAKEIAERIKIATGGRIDFDPGLIGISADRLIRNRHAEATFDGRRQGTAKHPSTVIRITSEGRLAAASIAELLSGLVATVTP